MKSISKIDTEDEYQIYKFTAYANTDDDLIDLDNNSNEITQRLQQGGIV